MVLVHALDWAVVITASASESVVRPVWNSTFKVWFLAFLCSFHWTQHPLSTLYGAVVAFLKSAVVLVYVTDSKNSIYTVKGCSSRAAFAVLSLNAYLCQP